MHDARLPVNLPKGLRLIFLIHAGLYPAESYEEKAELGAAPNPENLGPASVIRLVIPGNEKAQEPQFLTVSGSAVEKNHG